MAIPTIRPYAMPTETNLESERIGWRLEPARAVLLIHDMQRYFVRPFPADRSPVVPLLAHLSALLRAARAAAVPVVYTTQPGRMSKRERGLLLDFWGAGMASEPADRDIVPEIRPEPGDVLVEKRRYSAFHGTRLDELIRGRNRDQLIIGGVYAHIGCLATACGAFTRDIQPFLVADAIADFTAIDHRLALRQAARTCAMTPLTDQILTAFDVRTDPISIGGRPGQRT